MSMSTTYLNLREYKTYESMWVQKLKVQTIWVRYMYKNTCFGLACFVLVHINLCENKTYL